MRENQVKKNLEKGQVSLLWDFSLVFIPDFFCFLTGSSEVSDSPPYLFTLRCSAVLLCGGPLLLHCSPLLGFPHSVTAPATRRDGKTEGATLTAGTMLVL